MNYIDAGFPASSPAEALVCVCVCVCVCVGPHTFLSILRLKPGSGMQIMIVTHTNPQK